MAGRETNAGKEIAATLRGRRPAPDKFRARDQPGLEQLLDSRLSVLKAPRPQRRGQHVIEHRLDLIVRNFLLAEHAEQRRVERREVPRPAPPFLIVHIAVFGRQHRELPRGYAGKIVQDGSHRLGLGLAYDPGHQREQQPQQAALHLLALGAVDHLLPLGTAIGEPIEHRHKHQALDINISAAGTPDDVAELGNVDRLTPALEAMEDQRRSRKVQPLRERR